MIATLSPPAPKTPKGARTRAAILDAALRLFRDLGYEQATMRSIAEAAGVSLGNAYYYFGSKGELIQAFYARTHVEHLAACRPLLETETDFRARLLGVMRAKLDTAEPYHRFSGVLFKTAADPASPLNPFSDASTPVRREATALFAEVVAGSDLRVPPALADELPKLLWLYHMGVILFWVHDRSPGCTRSYALAEQSVDLVVLLLRLGRNPLLRPLIRRVLALVETLEGGAPGDDARSTDDGDSDD